MKKKILIGSIIAVALLTLVSFSSVVGKVSLEPIPDLDCTGSLSWTDIEPGGTLTGTFTVENIGEEGSLLDWEIQSYPDWGSNWTFDPDGGIDLPKGAPVTVDVEVVAPDDLNEEFEGEIKIVNLQDPDDYCIIDISIAPIINAKDIEINDDTTEPLDVGRFRIRGFGLFPRYSGENVTFFALRLSYMMINGTERTIGVCWLKRITLPRSTITHVGPFNIVIYVIGGGSGNPFEAPFINDDVSKSSLEPVPDLDCTGDLDWVDVEPGATVYGSFTVENIGEPSSLLDWEIESYPDWGTWRFSPDGYLDLTPEAGAVTVTVEIVLPDEIEDDLWGDVLIVNLENSSDYCIIEAWIQVKSIDDATSLEFEFQRIRDLVQSIDLVKIIVNPDGVIDTLEEISSILENEDVRNYIEKSSEEDCGCEDDNSDLEWIFPVICTLLVPFVYISLILQMTFGFPIFGFIFDIGEELNCFWAN